MSISYIRVESTYVCFIVEKGHMVHFVEIAEDLELAGLLWKPEIGDEVCDKKTHASVSILVDPQGMTPRELRTIYLWLPTLEQMILQVEARQSILFHAGLELSDSAMCYKTVLQSPRGKIESSGETLRTAIGIALRNLILAEQEPRLIN
jgi:hypothetical protein